MDKRATPNPNQLGAESGSQETPSICSFEREGWHGEFVVTNPLYHWIKEGGEPLSLNRNSGDLLKEEGYNLCLRLNSLGSNQASLPHPLFFKRHFRNGPSGWIKRLVGWHRAAWMWRASWNMLAAGVPVPRPLGYLDPKPFHPRRCSFFWAEWIGQAQNARQLVQDRKTRKTVIEDNDFAARVAETLARLHNHGLYHRDTSWKNLLLNPKTGEIWLIDIDSVHRGGLRPAVAAVRDVARFLTDAVINGAADEWRDRFLDRYADLRKVPASLIQDPVEQRLQHFLARKGWSLQPKGKG